MVVFLLILLAVAVSAAAYLLGKLYIAGEKYRHLKDSYELLEEVHERLERHSARDSVVKSYRLGELMKENEKLREELKNAYTSLNLVLS
jgi:hypothetical protein